jgi:uncharacterized PurR-regulated membrane protein YhhQ (DUF165 family)
MTERATRRELMLTAILLAGLLDFAANWLAAHVLLPIGPFLIPGGTFAFAFSFTIYDYIRRQCGLMPTLSAIGLGFALSVFYSVMWGGGVGNVAVAGIVDPEIWTT